MTRAIKPRRNPTGRAATHAGRAIERVSRQNLWDKRTTIYAARCDRANAIVEHYFGGWEDVGALDSLVWATADVTLIIDSISGYVARQGGPITAEGTLLPVLAKGFVAYQNLLRLHHQALADAAAAVRQARRGPTLQEYLAKHASAAQPSATAPARAMASPASADAPEDRI